MMRIGEQYQSNDFTTITVSLLFNPRDCWVRSIQEGGMCQRDPLTDNKKGYSSIDKEQGRMRAQPKSKGKKERTSAASAVGTISMATLISNTDDRAVLILGIIGIEIAGATAAVRHFGRHDCAWSV